MSSISSYHSSFIVLFNMLPLVYRYSLILFTYTVFVTIGCTGNQPDTETPQIQVYQPIMSDTTDFYSGDSILFHAVFDDNEQLQNYHLEINMLEPSASAWDTSFVVGLMGDKSTISLHLPIPLSAPTGLYQLEVFCLDNANNQSDKKYALFRLQNAIDTILPNIELIIPTSTSVTIFGSSNFALIGELTDDQLLGNYYLKLTKNTTAQLIYQSLPIALDSAYFMLQETVPIPATSGAYSLDIYVLDGVNNMTKQRIALLVL